MRKSVWIPVISGVIAQLVARDIFDSTRAEGFIAYMLGVIVGYICVKEDAK